nr:hypothetical protein Q903MT_gene1898 [Picea sitchensis]
MKRQNEVDAHTYPIRYSSPYKSSPLSGPCTRKRKPLRDLPFNNGLVILVLVQDRGLRGPPVQGCCERKAREWGNCPLPTCMLGDQYLILYRLLSRAIIKYIQS